MEHQECFVKNSVQSLLRELIKHHFGHTTKFRWNFATPWKSYRACKNLYGFLMAPKLETHQCSQQTSWKGWSDMPLKGVWESLLAGCIRRHCRHGICWIMCFWIDQLIDLYVFCFSTFFFLFWNWILDVSCFFFFLMIKWRNDIYIEMNEHKNVTNYIDYLTIMKTIKRYNKWYW